MQWFNILTNSCYLLTWTIEITLNDGLFNAFYIWNQIKWLYFPCNKIQMSSDFQFSGGGDTYLPF